MASARASASDGELWRLTAAGDAEAFAELYRRHGKRIYNYLFRRLGSWSEAEDLLASVFLEAYRRREEALIEEEKVVGWLFGIATNLARNRQRSLWRARRLFTRLATFAPAAPPVSDAAARTEAREQMRALLARISVLPREQQDVVALCSWSGLSYEEAASALSVPVGTVRSRLARARAALAELEPPSRHELGASSQRGEVIP
jgi:RNA polymerase sigma-70 factor (ECF subfamily)